MKQKKPGEQLVREYARDGKLMTGFCGSLKHSGEQPHHGRRQSFTVFLKPGEGLIKMSSSLVIRGWRPLAGNSKLSFLYLEGNKNYRLLKHQDGHTCGC